MIEAYIAKSIEVVAPYIDADKNVFEIILTID